MLRHNTVLRAAPMYMPGFPVDSGKYGQTGRMGKQGEGQYFRFQNRVGDALNWSHVVPEWYWERGGYEPMGNMPEQWARDGFGDFLVGLSDTELEMLTYDVLHDIVLEENLRDGIDLRAPHPDTYEPMYGKIPAFIFNHTCWSRPDMRERVLDRVWKAFRITPPFHQRVNITGPVELVSWIQARVAFARKRPEHHVPREVRDFLTSLPESEQPRLGFLNALPPKERTSLRKALNKFYSKGLLWNFEYKPKPQGEDDVGREGMYWLQMEREERQAADRAARRSRARDEIIARRRARREGASA